MDEKKPGKNPWSGARIKRPTDDAHSERPARTAPRPRDDAPWRRDEGAPAASSRNDMRPPTARDDSAARQGERPPRRDRVDTRGERNPADARPRGNRAWDARARDEGARPTRHLPASTAPRAPKGQGDASARPAPGNRPFKPSRGAPPTRGPAPAMAHDAGEVTHERRDEARIYGRNACLAAFRHRPATLRKVYLTEARLGEFRAVLAWCVQHRLGYRVVETDDLDRLTESTHHEGICFDMQRTPPLSLAALLRDAAAKPHALIVWLDGVGNPHNVGAILRSAANFGVAGLILPAGATTLPGAALRVAEGGAEAVPCATPQPGEDVAAELGEAGFAIAASVPREGIDLYACSMPDKLALVLGAEGEGMSKALINTADLRLTIPGTTSVESLNVAASAAVLFAEFWRQHHAR